MTSSHEFHFTSTDGSSIACARWDAPQPAKAIVQIAHGMGEHIGRYHETIELLVSAGFTVYGNDHRGHGRTALRSGQLGVFGEGGFDLLVRDMVRLSAIARRENPALPLFLLGHSMGSFAAQHYALDHSREIDGLILSGSGALDRLAHLAASTPSTTNLLNARFEPARTPLDWLSRDQTVVDAFIGDPLCFPELRPQALASFLGAGLRLSDPSSSAIQRDLPVYLFSGSEDPVGEQLEGVRVLIERYRAAGIHDITTAFYSGGRHEMLNETNRAEVRARLVAWLRSTLKCRVVRSLGEQLSTAPLRRGGRSGGSTETAPLVGTHPQMPLEQA